MENHENIFHRRAKALDRLFPGKARLRTLRPVSVKWHDIGTWIGLQGHGWNVRFLRQTHRREANLRQSCRNRGGTRIEKKSRHAPPNTSGPSK
ncbi:MAG: hypothetical protein CR217_09575 [Beijerinckiaceae bacterium]|nr:MAG: hypothetical protein CR217_09575 [Beijerinckiaceae bacterium]